MKREEMIEKIQDEVSKNYITTQEELKARCEESGLDWSDDILGGMGWNCCDRCGALGDSELDLCWIDCIDWSEDDSGDKKLLDNIAKEGVDYCALCWNCIGELRDDKKPKNQTDSDFVIHERKPIEIYSDLEGNIVEENDQIQSEYVVRCNITGDRINPTWEDQADFETLKEAEKFLAECRSKENER